MLHLVPEPYNGGRAYDDEQRRPQGFKVRVLCRFAGDHRAVASFAWWRGFAALRGGLVAAITQDWLQVGVAV